VLALRSAVERMMQPALADGHDTHEFVRRFERIASVMAREMTDEWRKGSSKRKMVSNAKAHTAAGEAAEEET